MKRGSAKKYNSAKLCPYCKSTPRYDKKKHQYICGKCGAKVNADTRGRPLGSVANKEMAYKRWYAHSMIEPLGEIVGRANVYKYLSLVSGRQNKVHMAKLSDIQLDIMISFLENTTSEKICERLGIKMKTEEGTKVQKDVREIIEEVYKEKIESVLNSYDKRLSHLEYERALEKFEERLRVNGLNKHWAVSVQVNNGKVQLWLYSKRKSILVTEKEGIAREDITSILNQCKVPFKMWEGQEKPIIKQWLKVSR